MRKSSDKFNVVNADLRCKKEIFTEFVCDHPLRQLRNEQPSLRNHVIIGDDIDELNTIAGVDVSYFMETAIGSVCRTGY